MKAARYLLPTKERIYLFFLSKVDQRYDVENAAVY